MAFPRADKCGRLYQPENDIHIFQCIFCHIYHIFAQFIFCFMDTRRIHKYDLSSVRIGIYCLDAVSGGLWLIGCNRDLLSDHMVHQGRFSHIRTADQRYKS